MTWTSTHPRKAFALLAAVLVGLPTAPSLALAGTVDPDASRIAAAGHSLKWNWTPPGRTDRYGHAETLIHAPIGIVRSNVVDFSHYRDIFPERFKSSRVVGHQADRSTDVYIQIAVLHGVVLLWDVARFAPPRELSPGTEVIEGRMVPGKGNVQDMDVVWTLRALDDQWTVLKFDLLLKPGLPAPQWAIDEELRDSARIAVDSMHDRAQGTCGIAHWPSES
ncbi:MAG TPA: hypothetical protein VEK07_14425 [Polyangiaceae bacterium]|nr:hypothetical protein [Polyangiaceae bacterium]